MPFDTAARNGRGDEMPGEERGSVRSREYPDAGGLAGPGSGLAMDLIDQSVGDALA